MRKFRLIGHVTMFSYYIFLENRTLKEIVVDDFVKFMSSNLVKFTSLKLLKFTCTNLRVYGSKRRVKFKRTSLGNCIHKFEVNKDDDRGNAGYKIKYELQLQPRILGNPI